MGKKLTFVAFIVIQASVLVTFGNQKRPELKKAELAINIFLRFPLVFKKQYVAKENHIFIRKKGTQTSLVSPDMQLNG